jgi:hypothetical protein
MADPTSTTVYQQALPEYAAPYFERLLQRAETESLQGYQPYTGARLAGFAPLEEQAQAGYGTLAAPGQLAAATGVAAQVAGAQVPDAFQYATATGPGAFQAAYAPTGVTSGYQAGPFQAGYAPTDITAGYTAGPFQAAYTPTGIMAGYQAGVGPQAYTAGQLGIPTRFDQGLLSQYMSPYQEQVTSAAVREIEKAAQRGRTGVSQAASQAGGRGGYREALERAELQRNVLEQVGDVTSRGRQAAFESALQQLERDRQAQMQGFQVQEAARQAQAASGLAGFQAQEAARQAQAQLGLTAQELGGRQALSSAELAARQEAAREAARQAQAQMGMTAQQASQQQRLAAAQLAAQQEAAREAARQAQAQMGMTAQQATGQQQLAAAELAARQEAAREAARQQQAQLGLAGLQQNVAAQQQRLAAAQQLGALGAQEQAMGLERLSAQEAAGQRQRAMRQASLDVGYEDFLRQMGYTQGQLGFFSNILRGVPVQPTQTVSTFQQQPSLFQSVLGTGLGALGLYKAFQG